MSPPDVTVQNEGSLVLLRPKTEAGTAWLDRNIGSDNGYQPYWPTVVVEPRYLEHIIEGMQDDGLVIE